MASELALLYSEVFAPQYFVLLCGLLLLGYEWRARADRTVGGLALRIGATGSSWVVAFAVFRGLPALFGDPPTWAADATGSIGLAVGMAAIWTAWRVGQWGELVPTYALVLLGVTVPHLLVTPFWDVSSHVLYAAVPAGTLVVFDRRFAPLALVAVGMVAARPLAGAHTWLQSVGGFALAVLAVGALVAVRSSQERETARSLVTE